MSITAILITMHIINSISFLVQIYLIIKIIKILKNKKNKK
ncbi:hypothetical protein SH2C18_44790 [Clostridium sediminicola]